MSNYCSKKFTYLTIDLNKFVTYNCHTAIQQKIDRDFLKDNPLSLFNAPLMIKEREMMLDNQRPASCKQCWDSEDNGIESVRQRDSGYIKTHTSLDSTPETLEINVNSECEMNCVYCCKEYSSSWNNDIVRNGPYSGFEPGRYELTLKNQVLGKLTKKQIQKHRELVMQSVHQYIVNPNLKLLRLLGGEPFLDKKIFSYIDLVNPSANIEIYTGLGFSNAKLVSILEKLSDIKNNVTLNISAESTEEYYNLTRHGKKWNSFIEQIEIIKKYNINILFHMTISNVSILDCANFMKYFNDHRIAYRLLNTPEFLQPFVLDEKSKTTVIKDLQSLTTRTDITKVLINSLSATPTPTQISQCGKFLSEYAVRNSVDLSFLPNGFREFVNIE